MKRLRTSFSTNGLLAVAAMVLQGHAELLRADGRGDEAGPMERRAAEILGTPVP